MKSKNSAGRTPGILAFAAITLGLLAPLNVVPVAGTATDAGVAAAVGTVTATVCGIGGSIIGYYGGEYVTRMVWEAIIKD
ncbi:MAG: hypothetical protein WCL39_15870 [Armatimonadota bacterium]